MQGCMANSDKANFPERWTINTVLAGYIGGSVQNLYIISEIAPSLAMAVPTRIQKNQRVAQALPINHSWIRAIFCRSFSTGHGREKLESVRLQGVDDRSSAREMAESGHYSASKSAYHYQMLHELSRNSSV